MYSMEINNTNPPTTPNPMQDFIATQNELNSPAESMVLGLSAKSRSFITIVFLTVLGPIGLITMWLWNDDWKLKTKVVVTILTILPMLLIGLYIRYLELAMGF